MNGKSNVSWKWDWNMGALTNRLNAARNVQPEQSYNVQAAQLQESLINKVIALYNNDIAKMKQSSEYKAIGAIVTAMHTNPNIDIMALLPESLK